MDSPLYVLAKSAESELRSINDELKDPVDHGGIEVHVSYTTRYATPSSSLSSRSNQNRMIQSGAQYADSAIHEMTVTPTDHRRKILRVVSSSNNAFGKRMDPFAVELIETVLAKGVSILRLPVFPYTYSSEPLRCMEIRTHLLRRYAALPRNADHPTLIRATEHLLQLWGAKLVYVYAVANSETKLKSTKDRPELLDLVSPIKRPSSRRLYTSSNDARHDLSLFTVDKSLENDAFPSYEGTMSTGKENEGTTKPATNSGTMEEDVASKLGGLRSTKVTPKRGPEPKIKHKKSRFSYGSSGHKMQGIFRRWSKEDRDKYLEGMESYGVGTEDFYRLIPGKSYGQLYQISSLLHETFGVQPGSKVTDDIRKFFKELA